jgi:hypothetical protein
VLINLPATLAQCSACALVPLDWEGVAVTADNFANHRNNGQPPEIRYSQVGEYDDEMLDLVLTLTAGQSAPSCSGTDNQGNAHACTPMPAAYYGGLGFQRGAGREMRVTMTLRYTATDQVAVVPTFCMSFIDVGAATGAVEYVDIGGYGTVFSSYTAGSAMLVESRTLYGLPARRFRAATGTNLPDPLSVLPTQLSAQQANSAFRLTFTNTASFDAVFGTLRRRGCCQRIWFAGDSSVSGPCPVALPTPPPAPPPGCAACDLVRLNWEACSMLRVNGGRVSTSNT